MAPEAGISEEAFAVIREAMTRQGKVGIGRLVIAQREHVVVIEPHGKGMSLTTLRAAHEVRPEKEAFGELKDVKVDEDMVKLAESIIAGKTGTFDPTKLDDRYQAALHELVEAKVKGKKIAAPKIPKTTNVVDLMDALRKSVKASSAGDRSPDVVSGRKLAKKRKAS
jgi:DNA end-binding protein Ku